MNVEDLPIKTINVKDRAREDYGDLTSLIDSIKQFGVLQPITVDKEYNLIAGGRRLEACKQAGLSVIPVVVRRTNNVTDALEIELIENVCRMDFHWSEKVALEKKIFDLKREANPKHTQREQAVVMEEAVSTVNSNLQMAEILKSFPELKEHKTQKDAYKAYSRMEEALVRDQLVKVVEARQRDTSILRRAKEDYTIGDAIEGLKALESGAFHFAEVDPPYGIDIVDVKQRKVREHNKNSQNYTEWNDTAYSENIGVLARELFRICKDDAYIVVWHGATWYTETIAAVREAGFYAYDIPAIWVKNDQGSTANPDQALANCYEQFLVARKGSPKLGKPGRSNLFRFDPVPALKKIHPTEKPLVLVEEILETFTWPGMDIIIPFLGSGVTLRACYTLGRNGKGFDLSSEHKQKFLGLVAEDEENVSE